MRTAVETPLTPDDSLRISWPSKGIALDRRRRSWALSATAVLASALNPGHRLGLPGSFRRTVRLLLGRDTARGIADVT